MQRSFVVELYDDADVAARQIAGRIEHVVSGRSADFSCADTLFGFMAEILEGWPAEAKSRTPKRRKR